MLLALTLKLYLYSYVRQSTVVDETFPPVENRKIHHGMMTFVYSVDDSIDNVESDWECYPSELESESLYYEI